MLDVNKTGFVSAGDLDRVLCGVRDLISDDRMSIIDTEDMDMQVSCGMCVRSFARKI